MYFFYFYPLGLDRQTSRRPVLSWLIMGVMLVAFIWMRYFPGRFAFDPWDLVFFPGQGSLWTVATAVFMHGGWLHLIGNLLYFHVFAPPLEDSLGSAKFLLFFLLMAVAGNLVHGLVSVFGLLGQAGLGVLGASGGIAGLLAFSLIRFYKARVQVAWWVLAPLVGQNKAGRSRVPLAVAVVLWLLWQVVQAMVAGETGANVSFGAHLGGFFMGLILALMLGEWKDARAEARLAQAMRYFRSGHFHAAAGSLLEYLELKPDDLEALLELARVQKINGQLLEAQARYRSLFRIYLDKGDIQNALAVFDELTRSGDGKCLGPGELAKVAIFKEKQLDYTGALSAYQLLHAAYPQHPQGQRALVRVIVLCHGKVGDPETGRRWLATARRELPPGSWRDFLDREFNLQTVPDEDEAGSQPAGAL